MTTQSDIAAWAGAVFGPATPSGCAARALREISELFAHLANRFAASGDLAEEAADAVICLYRFCAVLPQSHDLDEHVRRKMLINRARRWHAHGDGHGSHCKLDGDHDHCEGCEKYGPAKSSPKIAASAEPTRVSVAIGAMVRTRRGEGRLVAYDPSAEGPQEPFLVSLPNAHGNPFLAWVREIEYLDDIPPSPAPGTVARPASKKRGKGKR